MIYSILLSILLSCLGGAPCCYLELLDNLRKWMCGTVGPSLAASLEPLDHRQCSQWKSFLQVLFWQMFIGTGSTGSTILFSWEVYSFSDILHGCSVTISRAYKHAYTNSFFPYAARLWNSLPIEFFLLNYNLNELKSTIERHLLSVGSF